MKNRCFHILVMALLVACVGCSPKAKQTIEPSQVIVTSYPSSIGEAGVAVYLQKDMPLPRKIILCCIYCMAAATMRLVGSLKGKLNLS